MDSIFDWILKDFVSFGFDMFYSSGFLNFLEIKYFDSFYLKKISVFIGSSDFFLDSPLSCGGTLKLVLSSSELSDSIWFLLVFLTHYWVILSHNGSLVAVHNLGFLFQFQYSSIVPFILKLWGFKLCYCNTRILISHLANKIVHVQLCYHTKVQKLK